MKKSTRILALILTLLMVFSAVPMSAMADAVSSEFNFTLDDSMVTNVVRATTSVDGDTINVVSESGEQTSSMRIKFRLPDGASVAFADGADATYAAFATANVLELKNPGVGRLNLPLTLTDSQGVTKTVMLKADFGNKVRYITNCTVAQNGDTLTVASGSATAYVVFDTTGIDGAYVEVENVSRNLLERYVTVGTEAVRFYNPVYDEGYVTVNIKNGDGETVRSYDVNVVFHQGKDANGNYIVSEYTPVLQTLRGIYAVDGDTIKVTANAGVTNVYINFGRYQAETLTASLNNNFVKKTGARSWRVMNTGTVVEFDVYFDATASGGELVTRHVEVDFTNKVPDKVTGVSATVEVDGNGTVKNEVSMSGETYNATVPAGVAVESDTLTLSVSEMESTGNIVADEMDMLQSYDVHVEGVSKENDVAIIVTLGEILPIGMNKGNVVLYHIENGVTNVMTQVFSLDELDAHNEFYYDPATGIVTVAMATFSEIAVASDTTKAWNGEEDDSWYVGKTSPYEIANADQFYYFAKIVGGMVEGIEQDSFAGKTVKLISDINFNDGEEANKSTLLFYPVGYWNSDDKENYGVKTGKAIESGFYTFEGTFDGDGHTISNIYQNTWEMKGDHDWYAPEDQHYRDGMGLFGKVYGGTVKNLTVDNFKSDGEIATTGVIAAYADYGATFENIAVTNCNPRVYNIGNGGIVGCVGWYTKEVTDKKVSFKNITVDNTNKISALWGSYDVACGGIVGQYYPTSGQTSSGSPKNAGIDFENCHVGAVMDVYNDVCANYQYYAYRYTGMMIGSIRENKTENGYVYPNMDGITATGCTVHYDTWNDYYYCELVANSLASYTHDHQFSRLEQVAAVNGTTITPLEGEAYTVPASGRYNYVVVNKKDDGSFDHGTEKATCYHFVDGAVWEHKDAGEETVNGETILKEDRQHYYLPFAQLFTGYGWGVTSKGIEDFAGVEIKHVDQKDSVEKFDIVVENNSETFNNTDYTVGDFFTAKAGAEINEDNVYLTIDKVNEDDDVEWTYTPNADNWMNGEITFTGTGEVKLTIQDYHYCTPTSITVTVNDPVAVEKFEKKLENENYLYRVGNQNAVSLGSLFKAKDNVDIDGENVTVTVGAVEGSSASGTHTKNATWTNGTIKFNGTGVVKVTITDNKYCIPTEITLEVVDAVNATTATSATANNVVLLNDAGFSSLEVSGGYTLFGNGFTLTCATDSVAADLGYSFVTLKNGTLDNVQIVCPNFDYAALYKSNLTATDNRSETDANGKTRYYNAKSGIMVSGNSQILNSRISGARAAVNISGGNAIIDNSRIELGAVANIIVGAANSVTLKDVTLVQKPTASTYNSSKTLMGFSVLVMCTAGGDATPITLEGTFVQNAWADEGDRNYVPSGGESIIDVVLKNTDYLHDIDGDGTNESLNLGIAYMPADGEYTVNNPDITDNRTDKDNVPYESVEVSEFPLTTYVYSYKNTNGTDTDFVNVPDYVPNKQGDIITVAYSDTADGLETGKSFETNGWVYELNVDLDKLSGYALDFSKLSMTVNGRTVTDYLVDGNAKPTTPVAVVAGGVTYTLTATIDGTEYTAYYKVTGTETSKDSPSLVASAYGAGVCVASSYGGTWSGAAPALEGIQIRYWSVAEKQYKTINLADYTPATKGKLNGTNTTWTYSPDNGDFTLTLTGGQVHSGNSVYAMPVSVDTNSDGTADTLYFVAASSNGLVNSGNGARTVPVSYSFKDNNGGTELTFSHTWSVAENKEAQYKYSDFCNGTWTQLESCITPDTLITLADGSQVRVDSLTGDEELLVWNLETGKLDTAPIMFVDSDAESDYEIIKLIFSDGTEVKVIYEHGFFDYDLGKYVYLDENAADYIGHTFAKQNGDTLEKVTLTDVVIETEVTTAWSPVTVGHLCYFVNGMLSMPGGVGGLFNIFEVDVETMTYDFEAMERDIETYGLFTYEEVNAIEPLSEEMFYAAGGQYLKISIAKGNLTVEELAAMIRRYSKFI